MQPNVESLIEAARRLPLKDQRRLAEALAEPRNGSSTSHRITEIRGVGKGLWSDKDAQQYVDTERDAWEN